MYEYQESLNIPPASGTPNEDIKKVFDLLAQGEAKMSTQPKLENVTLIMGNTGAGKSTLTQRLSGNDNALMSIKDDLDYTINKLDGTATNTSFATSTTTFPELVLDKNDTSIAYYDFPGYMDTRGTPNKLTSSYFMKKAVDKVKRIKILILINHFSLTNNNPTEDFINLFKHTTNFIKNIDKYKDAIALVVTKVRYPGIADSIIIQKIAASIEKYKKVLEKRAGYANEIKLIDLLLQQVGGTFPKIQISRSPNQEGLLSNIPLLQENKKQIKAMIENLNFVEKVGSDFGYFVPNDSLHDVGKVIREINQRISTSIEKSGKEMQKYFINQEDQIYDLSKLSSETSLVHSKLVYLKKVAKLQIESRNCLQELLSYAASMDSKPIQQDLLTAMQYAQYSSFLQTLSNYPTTGTGDSFTCAEGLNKIIQYTDRSKKWYKFLIELHNRLHTYEIQKDISNGLCTELANAVAVAHTKAINNTIPLLGPLKKCFPKYDYELNEIAKITLDEPKLNTLRRILDTALKYNLYHLCDSNKLTMKGNTVKLSDIFKCNREPIPNNIEIFALNKVFIDTDLNMTSNEAKLRIIAPTWENLGIRKITLADGHSSPKAQRVIILKENSTDGETKPPGTSPENFLGIGETSTDLQELTITVNYGQSNPKTQVAPDKDSFPNSYAINNYKMYARENLFHNLQESHLTKFLNHLEKNELVQRYFYDTKGFLHDFKNLESQYHQMISSGSRNVLDLYQSLLNRVESFASHNADNLHASDSNVLHYLSMAILSRISSIKYDLENYQVVDINGYFPLVESHIEEYKKQLKEIQINTLKEQYVNTINAQISEARYLVEQSIFPQIDEIRQQIDNQMNLLIQDIEEQRKQAVIEKTELIKKQTELAQQMPLRSLLKLLNTASSCLLFLGPWAVAGAQLVTSYAQSFMEPDETAKTAFAQVTTTHEREQQSLREVLESNEIESASSSVSDQNDAKFREISNEVSSLNSTLHQSIVQEDAYNAIKKNIKEKLTEYHDDLLAQKAELEKQTNYESESKHIETIQEIDSKINWANVMQTTFGVLEGVADYIKDRAQQKHKKMITAIGDRIQLVQSKINRMQDYEHDLKAIFIPKIGNTQGNLLTMVQNSTNESHAGLDFRRWKMQHFLNNFQQEMKNIVEISSNPAIKRKITLCIDDLTSGMMTTLQIFDRIQDYKDKQKFANYIADLKSAATMTNYGEYKQDIDELELIIKSNLVLQEYEKALGTFKQYIFPTANMYMDQFNVSSFLRPTNLTDVINKAGKEIHVLRDALTKKLTTVTNRNDYIFSDIRYNLINVDQKPFFTWKYDTHKEEIHKLLQGHEITMKSDVTQGIVKNAVKFKEIGIRFKLANETMQTYLDKETMNFLIKLTHSGDSYYRCNNRYYVLNHNVISLQHTVNTDPQNYPHYGHDDETSKRLKVNEPLFSPYATWRMQLISRSHDMHEILSKNSSIFDPFKQFFNQPIDLVLEGYGGHMSYPAKVCNDDLENYYTLVESISEPLHYNEHQRLSKRHVRRGVVTNPDEPIKSSANIIKSPINTAIRFIGDILGTWRSIYLPNTINYYSIKEGVQSWFGELTPFNVHTTKDFDNHFGSAATFNAYESLTLIDFFVRWVTKVKPYDNTIDGSVNSSEVTASVLNIITELEKLLNDLSIEYNLPTESLEFDPIVLMAALEKEVINGNCEKLAEIILQTVMGSLHNPHNAEFCNDVAKKITDVFGKEKDQKSILFTSVAICKNE
ncbi:uncharacterized protein LOC135837493 [Planococcus citri]|uniref:uncharacterized protein LOC135837493 n=1 Tax=Planococcus citri TaxID=170843 RepID=UPI0031F7B807